MVNKFWHMPRFIYNPWDKFYGIIWNISKNNIQNYVTLLGNQQNKKKNKNIYMGKEKNYRDFFLWGLLWDFILILILPYYVCTEIFQKFLRSGKICTHLGSVDNYIIWDIMHLTLSICDSFMCQYISNFKLTFQFLEHHP